MAAIEHRFIAGLAPESELWVRRTSSANKFLWCPLHLAQSDLDSGCGLHVLLSALMILLGLSRSEVLKLTTAKRGPLATLWRVARKHYFEGTDGHDLVGYVAAMEAGLQAERHVGHPAKLVKAVAAAVVAGEFPILRVTGRAYDHWVAVAGYECAVSERQTARPLALLVLDPGERAPRLVPYTGRIDVAPRVHRRTAAQVKSRSFSYRSISGDCVNAQLAELLVLRLAQAP